MSEEIPEDVMTAARALFAETERVFEGTKAIAIIARAILAERERAARIAETSIPDDCRREDLYRWSFTAEKIAAAIRGQK